MGCISHLRLKVRPMHRSIRIPVGFYCRFSRNVQSQLLWLSARWIQLRLRRWNRFAGEQLVTENFVGGSIHLRRCWFSGSAGMVDHWIWELCEMKYLVDLEAINRIWQLREMNHSGSGERQSTGFQRIVRKTVVTPLEMSEFAGDQLNLRTMWEITTQEMDGLERPIEYKFTGWYYIGDDCKELSAMDWIGKDYETIIRFFWDSHGKPNFQFS